MDTRIATVAAAKGGVGKTTLAYELAAALDGTLVDLDWDAGGATRMWGIDPTASTRVPLLDSFERGPDGKPPRPRRRAGQPKLIPSHPDLSASRIEPDLVTECIQAWANASEDPWMLIDTHPGLNEETLLSIAISDSLAIIMRPDSQDYQGTGVTVEVARKLDVPRMMLIINKTPQMFDPNEIKQKVEATYSCQVAGVLPHSDEMMALASSGIFVLKYPDHAITETYKQIADLLVS